MNLSRFKVDDHVDFNHAEEIETENSEEAIEIDCAFFHNQDHQRRKKTRPSNNHNPLISTNAYQNATFGDCKYQTILNGIELKDGDYGIQVEFLSGENHGINQLIGFEIEVTVLNSRFITYLVIMRYILCIGSIVAFCIYKKKLKEIPLRQLTFEHRVVKGLGLALIFLNDPFALMNTKYPNFLT